MDNQTEKKKCSSKKHSNIDAIAYCQKCKLYLCNKCQNYHSELFESHEIINLNNPNEVFLDTCNENNHTAKLEFYCKDHNTLCCVACISKLKDEGYGQHSDCDVCHIKNIKDEKRNKLKENINNLEELYKQIEKSINELKIINEEINKNKEELKLKVQTIFTKIRNVLNEKEDKLLLDIDNEYNNKYIKGSIIKENIKLPNKIKKSIDKAKMIEKKWNEYNLSSLINDCIIIENDINEINNINDKSNINIKIEFNIKEEQINNLIDTIKNFGYIIAIDDNDKIENKNPIYTLTNHTDFVLCLCILNDGRLVSGSSDKSIIIYNKNTYKPDLIIKGHKESVYCIIQLSTGELVSCSQDYTIKIYNIKGLKYEVIQTLNNHTNTVYKIIELQNKVLTSCSFDESIIFYKRENKEFKKDYQIETNGPCYSIIQTKDNEICYSERNNKAICFYEILEGKIKEKIPNINKCNGYAERFIMIREDLLLIPGENQLSIINTNEYKLTRIIDVPNTNYIYGVCLLNKNMLLTGDKSKIIRQWKIDGDNLTLISKIEQAHDKDINVLLNMGNGLIASGSDDYTIKIWKMLN